MKKDALKILSDEAGKNVVHLPECRFPGIVIQGDTFHDLYSRTMKIATSLQASSEADAFQEVTRLAEQLESILDHYEATLKNNYFKMPYKRDRENTTSRFHHSGEEEPASS